MPPEKPVKKQQAFQSVWTRPRTGREQPVLSREHIVAEALRLLDEEGIDALSMRKLGGRLGGGATSLYRHVANKDELIELAVDEIYGGIYGEIYGEIEVPADPAPANWRTDTARCAHSLRATILRHPWLASVLGELGMSYLGPNWMRISEAMLKLLTTAGFPADEADRALSTLVAYVTGMATSEAAWLNVLARSGQDEQTMVERLRPAAEEAAQDYPLLREGYAEQRGVDPRAAREEGFQYGLDRVLDGLETRLK